MNGQMKRNANEQSLLQTAQETSIGMQLANKILITISKLSKHIYLRMKISKIQIIEVKSNLSYKHVTSNKGNNIFK